MFCKLNLNFLFVMGPRVKPEGVADKRFIMAEAKVAKHGHD